MRRLRVGYYRPAVYISVTTVLTKLLKNKTVVAGFLYFSIPFGTGLASFLLGDQEFTLRIVSGVFIASLVNGLTALKAFFSTSAGETAPNKNEPKHEATVSLVK